MALLFFAVFPCRCARTTGPRTREGQGESGREGEGHAPVAHSLGRVRPVQVRSGNRRLYHAAVEAELGPCETRGPGPAGSPNEAEKGIRRPDQEAGGQEDQRRGVRVQGRVADEGLQAPGHHCSPADRGRQKENSGRRKVS